MFFVQGFGMRVIGEKMEGGIGLPSARRDWELVLPSYNRNGG